MLCILPYSCFLFIQNVLDSTRSPIKNELDPYVGSDGARDLKSRVGGNAIYGLYRYVPL